MEVPWNWLISATGFIIILYSSMINEVIVILRGGINLPAGYANEFMISALQTKMTNSFVPILAVIPFSGKYIDDVKSKFIRFYIIRTDRKGYLLKKIANSFACGGSIFWGGGIVAWGIASLIFSPMEKLAPSSGVAIQFLSNSLLFFLVGGMWSVVGMTMSSFMESKYIAYTSPFIIYYLLIILCERYFPNVSLLHPLNWTKADIWPFGVWGAAVFLLELTSISGLFFVIRAGKKLWEL